MSAKVDLLSYMQKSIAGEASKDDQDEIARLAKAQLQDRDDKFALIMMELCEFGMKSDNPADKAIVGAVACMASFRAALSPDVAAEIIRALSEDLKVAYAGLRTATMMKLEREKISQN